MVVRWKHSQPGLFQPSGLLYGNAFQPCRSPVLGSATKPNGSLRMSAMACFLLQLSLLHVPPLKEGNLTIFWYLSIRNNEGSVESRASEYYRIKLPKTQVCQTSPRRSRPKHLRRPRLTFCESSEDERRTATRKRQKPAMNLGSRRSSLE